MHLLCPPDGAQRWFRRRCCCGLPHVRLASASQSPANAPATALAATFVSGLSAKTSVARSVIGAVEVVFVVQNKGSLGLNLSLSRNNMQDCTFGPSLRVLRVGTREVMYPQPGASPKLCPQDMSTATVLSGSNINYSRKLNLGAGEYMIESWIIGLKDGQTVKVVAAPLRMTVK